ncbi:MAG: hydroxylamine reductase [Holophagaceae bacterium]|nr:hydroxylamine reductase [Holophagaceae bacterium]
MSMFCFQCQETAKNTGCAISGVCGKKPDTANLQDLLVYTLKGIAALEEQAMGKRPIRKSTGLFLVQSLFITITNANFDNVRITAQITEALKLKKALLAEVGDAGSLPEAATWFGTEAEYAAKAEQVGVLQEAHEDLRSLKSLVTYGVKGVAAYADHAAMLDREDDEIYGFVVKALAALTRTLGAEELVALTLETGGCAVKTMALLDAANTGTYGKPEMTQVSMGVRQNPGILVSGHDLRDLADLLEQTQGTGVDVYTHSEMLPAHAYPAFKKYPNLAGNYGSSWWLQDKEFGSFNGPILMTTNCIVPVRPTYKDRIFTSGMAGYADIPHIPDRPAGGRKDFSAIIQLAKTCPPPTELETGTLTVGFAHDQILALADKVVDAVKSGAVKRFVVMGGCDARQKERTYFTDVAKALPPDTIILTAGCAKYRYNKLGLGDIGGIPRVLDAGQCNDSYSLALVALKLKEVFGLEDINQLPISFDIAWYEQKAVAVLLALLYLGVKGIRLGPTLPAFLSPNVAKVLVEKFDLKLIGTPEADVAAIAAGV